MATVSLFPRHAEQKTRVRIGGQEGTWNTVDLVVDGLDMAFYLHAETEAEREKLRELRSALMTVVGEIDRLIEKGEAD